MGDGSYSLVTPAESSVLHRPFDGQIKHFKGTEENKAVRFIIRAGFAVCILRLSSIFRTQGTGEKELGTGVPHVFQGNIMMILKIVGIWRDNEYGILHKETQYIRCIPSFDHHIIQYIKYITVYYSISERLTMHGQISNMIGTDKPLG